MGAIEIIGQEDSATNAPLPPAIYSPIETLLSQYDADMNGIKTIASFVSDKKGLMGYFFDGNASDSRIGRYTAAELFSVEGAIAALNSSYWSKVLALTDVLEVMPATKRNEWSSMVAQNKTPSFERETVLLTVKSLLLNRGQFFAEKVDAVFRSLSREHVTNSPTGFGKRMIINYMMDRFGYLEHRQCEYVQDLRCVIAKLMGREGPVSRSTYHDLAPAARSGRFAEWLSMDGGALRIRLYKKGTAHLEVHPDVAWRLNRVLATLYPAAIATELRNKPEKPAKDHVLRTDFLPSDLLYALDQSIEASRYLKDHRIVAKYDLKPEMLVALNDLMVTVGGQKAGGEAKTTSWTFPFPPGPVLCEVLRNGCLPERVSHQFYPTPVLLAAEAVRLADIQKGDRILEPSAGNGDLAVLLPAGQTECVEISPVRVAILKARGLRATEADFLKWHPSGKFHKIVMNPPFSDGRALAHLRHAASMLENNGRLVAILPASMVNKVLVKGFDHTWGKTFQGCFEDTRVNVAILTLERQ
jgi:hypothetical protein